MPLYEYRCPKCGKTVEELRKASDRLNRIPRCHAPCHGLDPVTMDPIFPLPAFRLSWVGPPADRPASDIWEGTPLADSDGINQATYESKKIQVDLGHEKGSSLRDKTKIDIALVD